MLAQASKIQKPLSKVRHHENFPAWCERFLAYIEDKDRNKESEKVSEANRDAVQKKLYQETIKKKQKKNTLIAYRNQFQYTSVCQMFSVFFSISS